MVEPIVEFSALETELLRELEIAVFRNKLILKAQPPVTDKQLQEVSRRVDGELPPELLELWSTAFGGELDYDYEFPVDDYFYCASLKEVFYPNSGHYRDLYGWIDHEIESLQESAADRGEPEPERTTFLPFAGFEYLDRFYVSLEPEEFGVVVAYAQGIPWVGRLNENVARNVADSVSELFDQLNLDVDPFTADPEEFLAGTDMVARIAEIEPNHPELADKLKILVRHSIFDWQSILPKIDFSKSLSDQETKALRLAFRSAIRKNDQNLIRELHSKGAPFDVILQVKSGILNFAINHKAFDIVRLLLELQVEVGGRPIFFATDCPDDLLVQLVDYGVVFHEQAIYSAAESGALDGAMALVNRGTIAELPPRNQIIQQVEKRAADADESAKKIKEGKLGSFLTPAQYRSQAEALRLFAARLRATGDDSQQR